MVSRTEIHHTDKCAETIIADFLSARPAYAFTLEDIIVGTAFENDYGELSPSMSYATAKLALEHLQWAKEVERRYYNRRAYYMIIKKS